MASLAVWHRSGMTVLAALTPAVADAGGAGWSGGELALRFGAPVALVLVGLVVFLHGRTQRSEILQRARSEGPVDDGSGAALRTASGQVLAGLLLMLIALVMLFAVIMWRVVAGAA